MPSIYQLKPAFQSLLRPVVKRLASAGVTANQVTLFAAVLSVGYSVSLLAFPSQSALWLGLALVLFVRMALNAVDGMLAREFGQASKLGALLNELTDVVSDAALILAISAASPSALFPLAVFALMAALSEAAGLAGQTIGASRRYDGPFGKSDRAALLGVLGVGLGLGWLPITWVSSIAWLAAFLTFWTTANRVRAALAEAS